MGLGVRSHYTRQVGRAIALEFDRHILQVAMLAALDVSEQKDFVNKNFDRQVVDQDNPTFDEVNVDAGIEPGGGYTSDTIFGWIKSVSERFDERFVPRTSRFMLLRPRDFYTLTFALNANGGGFELSPRGTSGLAAIPAPMDIMLSGINIRMSNVVDLITNATHFTTNIETRKGKRYASTGAAEATGGLTAVDPYFNAEFIKVKAVALTPDAVGTLIYKSMMMETERDVRRLTNLVVGELNASHGVLSPDSAIVVNDQS